MQSKKEYQQVYYKANKSRILYQQYLRYNTDLTFCGSCGQCYSMVSIGKHLQTKRHKNNERVALFDPYSGFPYRADLYIRKLLI